MKQQPEKEKTMARPTQESRNLPGARQENPAGVRPSGIVPAEPQWLDIAFLYGERDEPLRTEISPLLQLLEPDRPWMRVKYHSVEGLGEYGLGQLIDKADVFLLVISNDFLALALKEADLFRHIMDNHRTGKALAVAFAPGGSLAGESIFKDAVVLQRGQGGSFSGAVREVLAPLLEEVLEKKQALENSWHEARAINAVESYWAFLGQHPRSRHSLEARKYLDELTEKELWARARQQHNVQGYFDYLSNAPLQEKRFEAALKISEIEDDEEKNWAEARNSDDTGLYFRYRAFFPEGKHRQEDEEALGRKLSEPGSLEGSGGGMLESNFLLYLACQRLGRDELFSLLSYLSYGARLRNLREGLERKARQRVANFVLYPLLILSIGLLFLPQMKAPAILEGGIRYLFWALLLILLVYRIAAVYLHFWRDFHMLAQADVVLKRGLPLLKAAYINNEHEVARKILARLHQVEQAMEQLGARSAMSYLLADRFTEPLIKEGYQYAA